jgi:hypothetical protein
LNSIQLTEPKLHKRFKSVSSSNDKLNLTKKNLRECLESLKLITCGEKIKYRIVIRTSDDSIENTQLILRLRLFGTNGKSQVFKLSQAKNNILPFKKGSTDVFNLRIYHIGEIIALSIEQNEINDGKIYIFYNIK